MEFFSAFITSRHQVDALARLLLAELDELDFMMPPAMRKCNQRLITQSSKAFLNIPIKSLNNTKIHCERIEMPPPSGEEPQTDMDAFAGWPPTACWCFIKS